MVKTLSIKQLQVLDFIKKQIELTGYSPSIRDICDGLGLRSTSTVHSHLVNLERKGYLKKDPSKPRSITVLSPNSDDNDLNVNHPAKNETDLPLMPSIKRDDLDGLFNSFLIGNPNLAIYKNSGDSMKGAGICNNDYVVVDMSKNDIDNQIVLAVVNNEYSTIKRFIRNGDMIKLSCENDSCDFISVNSKNVRVIGVVIAFIRSFL